MDGDDDDEKTGTYDMYTVAQKERFFFK